MIKKYTKSILYNNFIIYTISLSSALYFWYLHATHRTIMQQCSIACSFYNYEHIDNFFERVNVPHAINLTLKGTLFDIREWLSQEPAVYIDCHACSSDHALLASASQHCIIPKSLSLVSVCPEQLLIKVDHE